MGTFNHRRYRAFAPVHKPNRRWPNRRMHHAPVWSSVDLRDGNQALLSPMSVEQKLRMFDLLVRMGFREIEVGFPAASQPDFDFVRRIIEEDRIPEQVTIQVLTQAREALIDRTYEALKGVRRAIVHVYNSTNPAQREQVFGLDREGIQDIAVRGAEWVKDGAARCPETEWVFQYSPESFSATEPDYAVEICEAVNAVWRPDQGQAVILNLPATVESSMPNVFADQIEWFCDHLRGREHVKISVHNHNDRGCAVAAAELAVLAGADRVEGTLFGNGERTGNMDILTMAMNLYSQGIDPQLDMSMGTEIAEIYTTCTGMVVPPRHPWFGELVYTAFSGSHQDAIRKGMHHRRGREDAVWEVPYLPIDPADLGRRYEEVVRINSQSGKGGVAHVLERDHGISLPRWLAQDFSAVVQATSEQETGEVSSAQIFALFESHYCHTTEDWHLRRYRLSREGEQVAGTVVVGPEAQPHILQGKGSGAVGALVDALIQSRGVRAEVEQFDQHALGSGTGARAMACVRVRVDHGQARSAVAFGEDTTEAALQAVLSAVGRSIAKNDAWSASAGRQVR
ncbi:MULTISPECIES: 2-isopropylmalate synthase [Acidithiobacillus]|jgi:2-isopropylmalate synthase|uniref:2-isopropylmalate synthase n=3 Tax=root TaxID=1 RepID=B7JC84_ACIF2|nr:MULTISPECIES: 2-isopropylmalate synthase [Acidithiobacillus]ACH83880.1 2-isopropylmalate synthase [Acidithiobacillus ferrooxidans ATCC 53993]ACK79755.1 2-isopropylmalate synthase [Acidithiobacillus ferrooxidans ATCC 23270]MBN6743719.1 2-isopropylmalate synthase [Acidithiobacillus sp. MC2.2]MBN6746576.1 2-isopropylmalate synthase [Acidithiobacillus sp. PG05]MBU2772836.1 2-isopropylmalate synthase [Acidithiobacillus ferrooxidans]